MTRAFIWGCLLAYITILAVVFLAAFYVSKAEAGVPVVAPVLAPGHFSPREARVVMLMERCKGKPNTTCAALSPDGRQLWAVTVDLTYRTHAGDTITVPKGMVTDLASIPKFAALALPPDGPWAQAAIIHDLLYISKGYCVPPKVKHGHCSRATPYTRDEADLILRDAMGDLGISGWRVWAIYQGVHLGGKSSWGT